MRQSLTAAWVFRLPGRDWVWYFEVSMKKSKAAVYSVVPWPIPSASPPGSPKMLPSPYCSLILAFFFWKIGQRAVKIYFMYFVVFLYRSETPKKLPITSQSSPSNKTVLKPLYYPLSGWRWFDGSGSLAPVSVPAQSGSCFEARSEWYSGSDNRLM